MTTTTNTTFPLEYRSGERQFGYGPDARTVPCFSEYSGRDIVKARIAEAIDACDATEDEKSVMRTSYRVTLNRRDYSDSKCFTRVYVGGYGERTFISSKMNQSIEMDRVIAQLKEYAASNLLYRAQRQEANALRELCDAAVRELREELSIEDSYRAPVSIDTTSSLDKVRVRFDLEVTPERAREIVRILKALTA